MKSSAEKLAIRLVGSVKDLDPAAWDALDHGPSPFLRHGFLRALEESGSIDPSTQRRQRSGWGSIYILAERGGRLVGAVPAFLKSHSYGEYIFDWGWANAAARAGIEYYPKLVIAAPITPATGNRILLAPDAGPEIVSGLVAGVRAIADDAECSSIHWLFCTAAEQRLLVDHGFFGRTTMQFHWKNRGYASFDAFLAELKSRKRKQLRKEHERARAAVDTIEWKRGDELSETELAELDRFYRHTTDNHGGQDYLKPGFFEKCAKYVAEMRMVQVTAEGKHIAGALFFETPQALYGRYWGADAHVDLLHFETAYYAGIERAIAQQLPLFEAGAQGEHKLTRGFEPSATYSAHWIRHPGLSAAIEEHCARERIAMVDHLAELAKAGPYRDGTDD
ncbi:MAG: peptidogalycan biosysnthesis protein [Kofleriaceae bacterium]